MRMSKGLFTASEASRRLPELGERLGGFRYWILGGCLVEILTVRESYPLGSILGVPSLWGFTRIRGPWYSSPDSRIATHRSREVVYALQVGFRV